MKRASPSIHCDAGRKEENLNNFYECFQVGSKVKKEQESSQMKEEEKQEIRNFDSQAIDNISSFISTMPPKSPHRKTLVSIVSQVYPTQQAAAKRLNIKQPLVSRALHTDVSSSLLNSSRFFFFLSS